MYKSTRDASKRQEKAIAKSIGGKRTPNSGATSFDKSDVYVGSEWSIEAKTCMTPKSSFSIKKDWLIKMKEEQFACNKSYSALCFDFGDEGSRYYIIDEQTFKQVMELMKEE
jgi:hypothetical protein